MRSIRTVWRDLFWRTNPRVTRTPCSTAPKSWSGVSTTTTLPRAGPVPASASATTINPARRITTELARRRATEQRSMSESGCDFLACQVDQAHAADGLDGDEADLSAARLLVATHRERQRRARQ